MANPTPKPWALKMLEGNPAHQAKRVEPQPLFIMPEPPSNLSPYALKEWKSISVGLFHMQILSEVDKSTLATYCTAYGNWKMASEKLNELAETDSVSGGLVVENIQGNPVVNPLFTVQEKAAATMLRCAIEMGMTPAARARMAVRVNPYQPKSKFGNSLLGGNK